MHAPTIEAWLGTGLVGVYRRDREGTLHHEGPRPGAGWHRHDWQRRTLLRVTPTGVSMEVVARRRWRQGKRGPTQLDRAPDELLDLRSTVVVVFLKAWAWLASGVGLHVYDEQVPALARPRLPPNRAALGASHPPVRRTTATGPSHRRHRKI